MKKELLQIIKSVVLGLLTLFLLTVTVFELLPPAQTTITAMDTITVSPSLISSTSNTYQLLVSGTIFNDSDETVTVDSLTVKVTYQKQSTELCIPLAVELSPRAEYMLSYSTESSVAYEQVESVSATVNGKEQSVTNSDYTPLGPISLLLIALTLIAGYFCYRSVLVCYYAKAEKNLKS